MARRGRLAVLALCPLLLAACGSSDRAAPARAFSGPENTIRVALSGLRWPLDPAFVEGRDETTLAQALLATPLRTSHEGELEPGLCNGWSEASGGRRWRFDCRHARAIAAELRRVRQLRYSPLAWLFSDAVAIQAPNRRTLVVKLRRPWRRFPYALTVPAAAPRGVRGTFRVVERARRRLVALRGKQKLVFLRLEAREAARAFLRGRVDEAPVPLGELRAFRVNERLRPLVHVKPLLGVDVVGFRLAGGVLADLPKLRRVYWETASRDDYAALVPEFGALPAFGILPGKGSVPTQGEIRRARGQVGPLPEVPVRVAVGQDPRDIYGADLAVASWRDYGFGPVVRPLAKFQRRLVDGDVDAWFRRLVAPYPQTEGLLASLLLPDDGRNPWLGRPSPAETFLRRALAARAPAGLLARADAALRQSAAVVPLAGAIDARLVSPRLRGWREDALGVVDYSRLRARRTGS